MCIDDSGRWKCSNSYVLYDSVYDGEYRNYIKYGEYVNNWYIIDNIVSGPPGILYPSVQPYASVMEIVEAVDIYMIYDNTTGGAISQIVDFGVNMAGVVKINVDFSDITSEKNNDINDDGYYNITIRHAEIQRHEPYDTQNGELYYDNLRAAKATDIYVFDTNSSQYVSSQIFPYFTYQLSLIILVYYMHYL